MQEDRRGAAPGGHFADVEGRSAAVPVAGLVHRWPDPVRWVQRQHHPRVAGVRHQPLSRLVSHLLAPRIDVYAFCC